MNASSLVFSISACLSLIASLSATESVPSIAEREERLGTGSQNDRLFHSAILPDSETTEGGGTRKNLVPALPLSFPGFLIGLEKIKTHVSWPCEVREALGKLGKPSKLLEKETKDPKQFMLTHALQWRGARNGSLSKTTVFNAYAEVHSRESLWNNQKCYLEKLRDAVQKEADTGRYTHLCFFSTGWNTSQWESAKNYNDWVRVIRAEAKSKGQDFRPLFLGLSWDSIWPKWLKKLDIISIFNKANDADEIGACCVSRLLRDVLIPVKRESGLPLVMLGHSLGCRLVTLGAYTAQELPESEFRTGDIDLIIGLEGAFESARWADASSSQPQDNLVFPPDRLPSRYMLLTNSWLDQATCIPDEWYAFGIGTNSSYIGWGASFSKGKRNNPESSFDHAELVWEARTRAYDLENKVPKSKLVPTTSHSKSTPLHYDQIVEDLGFFRPSRRPLLIDASTIIDGHCYCNNSLSAMRVPKKANVKNPRALDATELKLSAHSDVYDCEMGHLIWGAMTAFLQH